MTKYICKCGRVVAKSTSADNTGNRDTENCKGCPYLLPWGPTQWDATRHAMVTDVKGYECRMSPSLDYATYYQGGGEDKCVLHIYSLDYDFLDQVTTWAAKQFPDKEISCSFDRSKIRAAEFVGGLYGMSVYPMQNKKGMAAKAALIERFFGPDGHRLDKTPEEEKAHVLAAIEAGKAKAQERKENMDYIISKHEATGRLYAYYKGSFWFWDSHIQRWLLSQFAEDLYQEERPKRRNFEREHFLAQTSDFHQLDDYEVPSRCIEALLQCNPKAAKKENLIDSPCASSEAGEDTNVPTSSAAATAAAEETAATPEPLDSASMTAAPVAKTSEPAGVAAENALAGADGSTAFDYSGLDTTTVDTLHVAERIIRTARQKYIVDMAGAVSMVHGELVRNSDEHNNQHTEDTFIAWCRFMGISKTTAYQLLQVQSLISGATAEEQATLEAASPSLLYAAAKPSAPAELVQAVKDGEITTHKQYQEALAEIKARDAKIQELLEMSEGADRSADAADARAKKAEQERDAARDAQANLSAMANKFSKQRDAAEQRVEDAEHRAEEAERRARAAEEDAAGWKQAGLEMQELVDQRDERIRELESGITVEAAAVDQEEIDRRANEISEPLVKIINRQNEEIQQLAAGNTVSAQASVLEHYLKTMESSLLSNAHRAELASYDIGALDSLARALREFADSIDGIFEDRSEDND